MKTDQADARIVMNGVVIGVMSIYEENLVAPEEPLRENGRWRKHQGDLCFMRQKKIIQNRAARTLNGAFLFSDIGQVDLRWGADGLHEQVDNARLL